MDLRIRPAELGDDAALAAIDARTWSVESDVLGPRAEGSPFFTDHGTPDGVFVAVLDGAVVGWVRVGLPTPLPSNAHVRQIQGLGVDPGYRRRGIARRLVDAACDAARQDGGRRLTLRVLGTNPGARRLYAAAGFAVEGVLPGEFHLGGADVDDVLMGRSLV